MKYALCVIAVIVIGLIAFFLAGCAESSPATFATAPVLNERGQTVTFVRADLLHGWVTEHKTARLVALTSYSGEGGTRGYVIVYELPPEAPR